MRSDQVTGGEELRLFLRREVTARITLERRDRVDDLSRRHIDTGVVWNIDVESGVHRFIRLIRGRVFYHRDLVAELTGITNS